MMYMIGDEVIHNGQTYVSLINYNDCALDNYLAWKIKKEERNFEAKMRRMTDYIDRQAAFDEISKQQTYKMFYGEDTMFLDANDVRSVLASIPSAEVEPIKKGKWVLNDRHIYECSECGLIPTHEEKEYWHYCPDCGAKMSEGSEDGQR